MSETKVEIVAVKEVSAEMRHPESCMCEICQTGSGTVSTPGLHDLPQMPIDMLVGRIRSLEEQLQIRDAEIHLLKESRAAAVSQEQTSRVECNRLRGETADLKRQLAEAQAELERKTTALEFYSDENNWVASIQLNLTKTSAACRDHGQIARNALNP